jgi:hypothetical protein
MPSSPCSIRTSCSAKTGAAGLPSSFAAPRTSPAEALACLREARTLAEEIGLPGELWQIWAALGELHEQCREPYEARGAFYRAASIVERLSGEIEDEALKEGFLSVPQPRRVLVASARKP